MAYTRENPSAEYVEAIRLGKLYHASHKTWTGKHSYQSFPILRKLIQEHGTKTLLDYGCGKNLHLAQRDIRLLNHKGDTVKQVYPSWQEALGVDEIYSYDPCLPQYEKLPDHPYQGLTCTDAMEHIVKTDLPWVVDTMMSFATQWVYVSVALFAGTKSLADGSLAHKALMTIEAWLELWHETGKRYPSVEFHVRMEPEQTPLTHRYFYGKGDVLEERAGFWNVFKPAQIEALTEKQRIEIERAAQVQKQPIDLRAIGKKA